MPDKTLSKDEITNLLATQPKGASASKWPSPSDLKRLAKAVRDRQELVEFEGNKVFKIRYSDHWDSVFVKPTNGDFVPCGYFGFDRLKGILKNGVDA